MSQLKYYDTGSGQWLPVLAGAQGVQGPAGTSGAQGIQGISGSTYTAPTIGSTPIASGATVPTIADVNLKNANLQGDLAGAFVTGGYNSNNTSSSTDNGATWVGSTTSAMGNGNWTGFAYGAGKFVAITSNSFNDPLKIFYSTDAKTWTLAYSIPLHYATTGGGWYAVTYGNGLFVAITGGTVGAVSTDGVNWTAMTMPGDSFVSLVYGAGKFVAVKYDNFAYSTDGTTWTSVAPPDSHSWGLAAYGNGAFIIAPMYTYDYTNVLRSTDGVSWSSVSISALAGQPGINAIAFGNNKFVATYGYNGDTLTSSDGLTWTLNSSVLSDAAQWTYLAFNGTKFWAWSYGPNCQSSDGVTWTALPNYSGDVNALGAGLVPSSGTLSVIGNAGSSGQVLTSTGTGVKWNTPIPSGKTLITTLYANSIVNGTTTLTQSMFSGYKDIQFVASNMWSNGYQTLSLRFNNNTSSASHYNSQILYLGGILSANGGSSDLVPIAGGWYTVNPYNPWSSVATVFSVNQNSSSGNIFATSKAFYLSAYGYWVTESVDIGVNTLYSLNSIDVLYTSSGSQLDGKIEVYGIN